MKNIVISLTAATDRRAHIKKEFNKHNVNFEFFDALTPDLAKSYLKQTSVIIEDTELTGGELACCLSHISIWQRMVDQSIPYAAIFEDDVYLGDDAEHLLTTSKWIDPSWHIIKIETVNDSIFLSTHSHEILNGKRHIKQLEGTHLGAGGYILSLHGAQLYLDYISQNKLLPIDEILFDTFISDNIEPVYQMIPALCIQEIILMADENNLSLPGTLVAERQNKVSSKRKPFGYKLKREAKRLSIQFKKAVFAKDIPFK